jgi:photosystem II stability/assembly factor-like uncharacterized protein
VEQGGPAFFSYSREDSEFAHRLAGDLKAAGANVWLDQLDIQPGDQWDRTVEEALTNCPRMVVILSPASVNSTNVMDEVSFALEERKTVIPVIHRDCMIPFRLRRVQHVDFRQDYAPALQELLKTLAPDQTVFQSGSAIPDVGSQSQSPVSGADERRLAAEQARLEKERRKGAKQVRLQEEGKQAAERARMEQEHTRAIEEARLEAERRKSHERIQPESNNTFATMDRVFISYSAKDKTVAEAVCTVLEKHKIRCWIAPRDITPGQEWGEAIIDAIAGSRVMILIFSASANGSPQIRREVERAVNREVVIVPLRIEDVLPTKSLEYFIGAVHWLDALTRPFEVHLEKLVRVVEGILGGNVATHSKRSAHGLDYTAPTGMEREVRPGVESSIHTSPMETSQKRTRTAQWNARKSGTQNELNSIFGTSDGNRLWAVGEEGTILESDDGGKHWNRRDSGTESDLRSIFGTSDGKRLWAVGWNCTILESHDRGEHWNPRKPGTRGWFSSIFAIGRPWLSSIFGTSDGKRLWAVGQSGTILESDDGGEHWNPRKSGTRNYLNGIFGTSDGKRLWAVDWNGTILESDDRGEHWNPRKSGTRSWLQGIFGSSDGKRLWAVGMNGTILESDTRGDHWNPCNSGTLNELNSIFGTSDGKRLWAVGEEGTILESDDGGKHWNRCKSGTHSDLRSIFGTSDGKRLWAVGDKGTILEAAVP